MVQGLPFFHAMPAEAFVRDYFCSRRLCYAFDHGRARRTRFLLERLVCYMPLAHRSGATKRLKTGPSERAPASSHNEPLLLATCTVCQSAGRRGAQYTGSSAALAITQRVYRDAQRNPELYQRLQPTQHLLLKMQAATLVALLIPVVAIWITVVVRYGRSIEEIVVATIEKEE